MKGGIILFKKKKGMRLFRRIPFFYVFFYVSLGYKGHIAAEAESIQL